MKLLVLAFLALDPLDNQQIASVRKNRDDPSRASVPLHFTLVFATDAIERSALVDHVQHEARAFPPFDFVANASDVVWDPMGELWLLRLRAKQGGDQIAELHDALYSGLLAPELRADIPYAPHVTVVGSKAKDECLAAQAELGVGMSPIAGAINALDVVEYDGVSVATIGRIELTGLTG